MERKIAGINIGIGLTYCALITFLTRDSREGLMAVFLFSSFGIAHVIICLALSILTNLKKNPGRRGYLQSLPFIVFIVTSWYVLFN